MKKRTVSLLCCALLLVCLTAQAEIPFANEQLYAVACVGYGDDVALAEYRERYLDGASVPVHYVSDGETYLIIPRFADMTLRLYVNDMETSSQTLIYEEENCRPFAVRCNISDIFPDVTISFTRGETTVEFSPYLSLKDGTLQPGKFGLDLTRDE